MSTTKDHYLVLDCETSGLFDFAQPADAPGQPRLASLALVFLDDTLAAGRIVHHFIRPDGWTMSPEVTAINGLTTEFLMEHGKPIKEVLAEYSGHVLCGAVVVAFNAQFDTKVLRGELRRAGLPDLFEATRNICVMRACAPVCRVPKKTGSGYKFPKLAEACTFFGITNTGAHSALGDALAAAEILRHLAKANLLPAPEVHYAKAKPEAAQLNLPTGAPAQ
jgi:DNA polymerase III epsilon subunit-like protein